MNKEKAIYGTFCGMGGVLIGLFANRLDTLFGGGLFALGVALLAFSVIKLNNE